MIQILTKEGKVLYELEQSEMFPGYCSVLKEAIALNVYLVGLYIDSENIDGVVWQGNNLDMVTFVNCSMKNNLFRECTGKLTFKGCNIQQLKINKSDFAYIDLSFCDLTNAGIRNSTINGSSMDGCIIDKAAFFNCKSKRLWLRNCSFAHTLFEKCNLNKSSFFGLDQNTDWYFETKFINCKMKEVNMTDITELYNLYFWDVDISSIQFEDNPKIAEITSTYSKVICAINEQVIWWKPHNLRGKKLKIPYKCTLEEFIKEVESGYPTKGIDHNGSDYELDSELNAVCNYLKFWMEY